MHRASSQSTARAGFGLVVLAVVTSLAVACSRGSATVPARMSTQAEWPIARASPVPNGPGDPSEGRRLFVTSGCGGCHTLGGVTSATGVAGPNLTNVVLRPTLAGETIPMTAETLAAFLRDPAAVKPGTSMPAVGLTAAQASDITAFLYSQPYDPVP
jgi:cytochrome c